MNLSLAINTIRPAVVQISFDASELSEDFKREQRIRGDMYQVILGTGFFVNIDGYVITALHVIEKGLQLVREIDAGIKDLYVGIGYQNIENLRGNFSSVNFEIIDRDENHDICLLRVRRNPFKGEVIPKFSIRITDQQGRVLERETSLLFGVPNINPNRPEDGSALGISGYPFQEPVLITNAGHVASSWVYDPRTNSEIYLGDVEINPGNSGGPTYLVEDASVIGVCVASESAPVWTRNGEIARIHDQALFYHSGLTRIIPSRYMVNILERNGATWSSI